MAAWQTSALWLCPSRTPRTCLCPRTTAHGGKQQMLATALAVEPYRQLYRARFKMSGLAGRA